MGGFMLNRNTKSMILDLSEEVKEKYEADKNRLFVYELMMIAQRFFKLSFLFIKCALVTFVLMQCLLLATMDESFIQEIINDPQGVSSDFFEWHLIISALSTFTCIVIYFFIGRKIITQFDIRKRENLEHVENVEFIAQICEEVMIRNGLIKKEESIND
jgi:hypothetical protein